MERKLRKNKNKTTQAMHQKTDYYTRGEKLSRRKSGRSCLWFCFLFKMIKNMLIRGIQEGVCEGWAGGDIER